MQLLNVKKFLQKIHTSQDSTSGREERTESQGRLLLAPDLFLECQELLLQITDDLFEVKLKANYEVHTQCTCTHILQVMNQLYTVAIYNRNGNSC